VTSETQELTYDHIIIGGGVFGCYLALRLVELDPGSRVLIIEREGDLLQRASYHNQARIHNGYHYPRSLLTSLRSRINFPLFVREFSECVHDGFDKLYAIATNLSKVNAGQFLQFCERIGAEIRSAPPKYQRLFNGDLIEEVFLVKEFAFDAVRLKELLKDRLERTTARILLNVEAIKVVSERASRSHGDLRLEVEERCTGEKSWLAGHRVYNCTYSDLNAIPLRSGLDQIFLRHEATEIALVRVPECLESLGVTVMCGPFFSVMPFPARGLHSLSHVSYTPHYEWSEVPTDRQPTRHRARFPLTSRFDRMVRDAARYLPCMAGTSYVDSLWEVKTILPKSDGDDGRPILFKEDSTVPEFISVLGGKIDNIFELDDALVHQLANH
jgi:glycine/D-amino acid oxidase-like deaminating enzyme